MQDTNMEVIQDEAKFDKVKAIRALKSPSGYVHPNTGQTRTHRDGRQYVIRHDGAWVKVNN